MNWWRKLQTNPLAKLGAILLLSFYIMVIGAEFVAPYDPYSSLADTSLLPPTTIYWRNLEGKWLGPHVYPTTVGPTSLDTGERELQVDRQKPSPLRFWVKGTPYRLLAISLPLPPSFKMVEVFPGIASDRHLFGVKGDARINLLGTDEQGRDQFSRIIYGGRVSLFIGFVGILISFPLGMIIGGISGYFGSWLDGVLMRLTEVLMIFPEIYLLISLSGVFLNLKVSLSNAQRFLIIVAITSFISWSGLARVIRGQVLSIKQQEFVQAAQALGAKPLYIILRHVLPQTASYLLISATLTIPRFIVAESVLSLIGLGIQQPDPSWGNLLSLATNASVLVLQPWLIWPPAILLILTVLSFNLLGDGLRDALDPRSLK